MCLGTAIVKRAKIPQPFSSEQLRWVWQCGLNQDFGISKMCRMPDSDESSVQLHNATVDLIPTTLYRESPALHAISEFAENERLKQLASGGPFNVVISV